MSYAKQHAEWMSLVEVSGPFLTLTVLNNVMRQGLNAHEPDVYRITKEAYGEWEETADPAIHTMWIRFLLQNVLEYPAEVIVEGQSIPDSLSYTDPNHGERLSPTLAIVEPESGRPLIPIFVVPRQQKLDSPLTGSRWPASPHTRMQLLLQAVGLQAGFVTNGAQWSLVHVRKGEPTGFATWQTVLLTEEPITLRAFRDLLGVARTLGAPEGETLFDMLDKAAVDAEEVTKELGRQVRQAVEVFVNALERQDRASNRELLKGATTDEIYASALTVMMRLVFMLCAEERDLFRLGDVWDRHYAVSTLNDFLKEEKDETVLEYRFDAWRRLLATFRLVHGGCVHEDMRIPAYGGSLFDPKRYPFLEEATVDNRTVLHLLDALEFLEVRLPGGGRERRRLSFRALGVEQIGHVYEGLLDHTARRAGEPILGLIGKETDEPEVPLSELEAKLAEGQAALVEHLASLKVSTPKQVQKLLDEPCDLERQRDLQIACGGDEELLLRVLPFANLIRSDSLGHLMVFPKGAVYMTAGQDRRSTGTHYTPVTLTEEVVQHALEPLVYIGPAEGKPRSEWVLKGAKEIVDLKVCDMAMGSGAFLVQACRYLAERLVEAWQIAIERAQRPLGFSPEGAYYTQRMDGDHAAKTPGTLISTPFGKVAVADPGQELIPSDAEERLSVARRIVADRCLYGVDKNPMAVEMGKLSLWLTTLRRDRPFTFLDHALRHGDSLLGVDERQLQHLTMRPGEETGNLVDLGWVHEKLAKIRAIRNQMSRIPSHDPEAIRRKEQLHFQEKMFRRWLTEAADVLILNELSRLAKSPLPKEQYNQMVRALRGGPYRDDGDARTLGLAKTLLGRPTFNWHLEFPDIFEHGGFHAVVMNPPFIGGWQISTYLGSDYPLLLRSVRPDVQGRADLVAHFFRAAYEILAPGGKAGLIGSNSVREVATRESGLDCLLLNGASIYRARTGIPWPGSASVTVNLVHLSKEAIHQGAILDGVEVKEIDGGLSSGLDVTGALKLKPPITYSQGVSLYGRAFVLPKAALPDLVRRNPSLPIYLREYVNGDVLNDSMECKGPEVVVDFGDLDRNEIEGCDDLLDELSVAVERERANQTGQVHEYRPWLHWDKRKRFLAEARRKKLLVACSAVSSHFLFDLVPSEHLYMHSIKLFLSDDPAVLGLLHSGIHEAWARELSSSRGGSVRYSTSKCFDTFPWPETISEIRPASNELLVLRRQLRHDGRCGLNPLYSALHDQTDTSASVELLRLQHVSVDLAVRDAYGWNDLELEHGFYGEGKVCRFTISPTARQEVLRRLLKLNHERYAAEVAAGLHDQKKAKGTKRHRSRSTSASDVLIANTQDLFQMHEVET